VNQAITQMDQVTQQNAALVEEASAAAESMKQQAQQLVQAVAVFKLAEGAQRERRSRRPPRPAAGAQVRRAWPRSGACAWHRSPPVRSRRSAARSPRNQRRPVDRALRGAGNEHGGQRTSGGAPGSSAEMYREGRRKGYEERMKVAVAVVALSVSAAAIAASKGEFATAEEPSDGEEGVAFVKANARTRPTPDHQQERQFTDRDLTSWSTPGRCGSPTAPTRGWSART